MRMLALDLGERRIGVATCDVGEILASPHSIIERSGSRAAVHRQIAELVTETGAGQVVVGLPLSMDGRRGPQARAIEDEVAQLAAVLDVPIVLHDERLTSVQARRARPAPSRKKGGAKTRIDDAAAAILLQSYLDGDR